VNININTSTSRKYHLPKNNSTLCSNNPLNNKKFSKKNLNQKLSQENSNVIKDKILSNSKRSINTGKNNSKKKFKKQIKLDSNLLMKKIIKPNNLKSMNDIFYIENSFSLNTEFRKKNNNNKNKAITTLNSSKNSSKEKIKINSQKKFNLKQIYHTKALTKANNELSINKNSSKNKNNNHIINKPLTKKIVRNY
jgi:hypothetical protein